MNLQLLHILLDILLHNINFTRVCKNDKHKTHSTDILLFIINEQM